MSDRKYETLDDETGKVVSTRGAKAYKKWEPKEWRPEYEAIVTLSCTGLSNKEVGRRFGYGPQQVSNIINTPQAKKLRAILVDRFREAAAVTYEQRLAALNDTALKNIEAVLDSDELLSKKPLEVFDRSLALLKSTGKLKGDNNAAPIQPGQPAVVTHAKNVFIAMPSNVKNEIAEALKVADEAKEIHGHKQIAVVSESE